LVLVLILSFTPACKGTEPEVVAVQIPEGWNQFKGDGFELYLPENWEGGSKEEFDSLIEKLKQIDLEQLASLVESNRSYMLFWAYDTEITSLADFRTNINIVSESAPSYSLNEYMDFAYENAADTFEQMGYEFNIIDQKVVSLGNNNEVGRTIVEQTIAGFESKLAQYAIKHDSDFWVLTLTTGVEEFDQNIQTFDKIVETFKITE
jgi:hypothetical protein